MDVPIQKKKFSNQKFWTILDSTGNQKLLENREKDQFFKSESGNSLMRIRDKLRLGMNSETEAKSLVEFIKHRIKVTEDFMNFLVSASDFDNSKCKDSKSDDSEILEPWNSDSRISKSSNFIYCSVK